MDKRLFAYPWFFTTMANGVVGNDKVVANPTSDYRVYSDNINQNQYAVNNFITVNKYFPDYLFIHVPKQYILHCFS